MFNRPAGIAFYKSVTVSVEPSDVEGKLVPSFLLPILDCIFGFKHNYLMNNLVPASDKACVILFVVSEVFLFVLLWVQGG